MLSHKSTRSKSERGLEPGNRPPAHSKWWLAHHELGPMEWLWRRLTYGQLRKSPIQDLVRGQHQQ